MTASRWAATLLALALACSAEGCGGTTVDSDDAGDNPLVGSWSGGGNFGATILSEQLTLKSDGTATALDMFEGCQGSLAITDAWTSSSSTLSTRNEACTGQPVCPIIGGITCGPEETSPQTCTYTLSGGDDTLVLDCPESQGPLTFKRQN